MVSEVLSELFFIPAILFPANAVTRGEIVSRNSRPMAAAPAATAAPARNLRRFKYKLLGVISEERISSAFLISMKLLRLWRTEAPGRVGFPLFSTYRTLSRQKSCRKGRFEWQYEVRNPG